MQNFGGYISEKWLVPLQNSSGNKEMNTCVVCGETSDQVALHYSRLLCNGCRAFFKRTVQGKVKLGDCKAEGRCIVDTVSRKACKPCRFEACRRAGVDSSKVQHPRDHPVDIAVDTSSSSAVPQEPPHLLPPLFPHHTLDTADGSNLTGLSASGNDAIAAWQQLDHQHHGSTRLLLHPPANAQLMGNNSCGAQRGNPNVLAQLPLAPHHHHHHHHHLYPFADAFSANSGNINSSLPARFGSTPLSDFTFLPYPQNHEKHAPAAVGLSALAENKTRTPNAVSVVQRRHPLRISPFSYFPHPQGEQRHRDVDSANRRASFNDISGGIGLTPAYSASQTEFEVIKEAPPEKSFTTTPHNWPLVFQAKEELSIDDVPSGSVMARDGDGQDLITADSVTPAVLVKEETEAYSDATQAISDLAAGILTTSLSIDKSFPENASNSFANEQDMSKTHNLPKNGFDTGSYLQQATNSNTLLNGDLDKHHDSFQDSKFIEPAKGVSKKSSAFMINAILNSENHGKDASRHYSNGRSSPSQFWKRQASHARVKDTSVPERESEQPQQRSNYPQTPTSSFVQRSANNAVDNSSKTIESQLADDQQPISSADSQGRSPHSPAICRQESSSGELNVVDFTTSDDSSPVHPGVAPDRESRRREAEASVSDSLEEVDVSVLLQNDEMFNTGTTVSKHDFPTDLQQNKQADAFSTDSLKKRNSVQQVTTAHNNSWLSISNSKFDSLANSSGGDSRETTGNKSIPKEEGLSPLKTEKPSAGNADNFDDGTHSETKKSGIDTVIYPEKLKRFEEPTGSVKSEGANLTPQKQRSPQFKSPRTQNSPGKRKDKNSENFQSHLRDSPLKNSPSKRKCLEEIPENSLGEISSSKNNAQFHSIRASNQLDCKETLSTQRRRSRCLAFSSSSEDEMPRPRPKRPVSKRPRPKFTSTPIIQQVNHHQRLQRDKSFNFQDVLLICGEFFQGEQSSIDADASQCSSIRTGSAPTLESSMVRDTCSDPLARTDKDIDDTQQQEQSTSPLLSPLESSASKPHEEVISTTATTSQPTATPPAKAATTAPPNSTQKPSSLGDSQTDSGVASMLDFSGHQTSSALQETIRSKVRADPTYTVHQFRQDVLKFTRLCATSDVSKSQDGASSAGDPKPQ